MNSELKTQIETFKKSHYLELRGKLLSRRRGKKIYFPEPKFDLLKLSNRDLKKYFKENGIEWKHSTHKNLYHNLISEKVSHELRARRQKTIEEETARFWDNINDGVPFIITENFDDITGETIDFSDLPPPPENL
tara:strand:- start:54 stop:455 length:402 start_codon:yes stop_codon:yes gene_type:complete